jgi:hypothetical protein
VTLGGFSGGGSKNAGIPHLTSMRHIAACVLYLPARSAWPPTNDLDALDVMATALDVANGEPIVLFGVVSEATEGISTPRAKEP